MFQILFNMDDSHKSQTAPSGISNPRRISPSKAESSLLPRFEGIELENILVPKTLQDCEDAFAQIVHAGRCGFDTEAKPTFRAGEESTGPHVVQVALADKVYVFQLHNGDCEKVVSEVIDSEKILKIGFGLKNDHRQIRNRWGIQFNNVLDLDQVFRQQGYKGQLGVRGAIAVLFKQNFTKSKRTTTSNWAKQELSSRQLLYAANDAFAALKVFERLKADGFL